LLGQLGDIERLDWENLNSLMKVSIISYLYIWTIFQVEWFDLEILISLVTIDIIRRDLTVISYEIKLLKS
jgi:hypothetical protein